VHHDELFLLKPLGEIASAITLARRNPAIARAEGAGREAFRDDLRTAYVLRHEESRRAVNSAKTFRLRAQRLAKEAAEREAGSRA